MDAKYLAEIKARTEEAAEEGIGLQQLGDLERMITEVERLNAELTYEKNANKTIPTMNGLVKRSVDKIKALRADNAAKDQQIATLLTKALELACNCIEQQERENGSEYISEEIKDYFIQQAQETQEAEK